MKYLKVALVATLSILICLSFAAPQEARGEAAFRYAYAKERDKVYFYEDKKASSALFAIPETYCVEILKDEGEWCYCRYAKNEGAYKAQFGYCLKGELTFIEEPLENEYLNHTFDVEFCAEQGSSQIDPFKGPCRGSGGFPRQGSCRGSSSSNPHLILNMSSQRSACHHGGASRALAQRDVGDRGLKGGPLCWCGASCPGKDLAGAAPSRVLPGEPASSLCSLWSRPWHCFDCLGI